MAKKEAETEKQDNEYLAIEKLKEINRTPDAAYQGMCTANGWKKGRLVTPEEYRKAEHYFLGMEIGGR